MFVSRLGFIPQETTALQLRQRTIGRAACIIRSRFTATQPLFSISSASSVWQNRSCKWQQQSKLTSCFPFSRSTLFTQPSQLTQKRQFHIHPTLRNQKNSEGCDIFYGKHSLTLAEAAEMFVKADKARFFAPTQHTSSSVTAYQSAPLKATLVPCFVAEAEISHTKYEGEYGEDEEETYTDSNGKTQTRTVTDWTSISGTIGRCSYSQQDSNMLISASFLRKAAYIEEAFEGYDFPNLCKLKFKKEEIDPNITIDPFAMRGAIAYEKARERIRYKEISRAEGDIKNRQPGCDHVRVHRTRIYYTSFLISSYLLPCYILQYPNSPPRVMSALTHTVNITGAAPISSLKSAAAAAAVTAAASFLFPHYTIAARLVAIAVSGAASAFYAKGHLGIRNAMHTRRLQKEREENESVAETWNDLQRLKATSSEVNHTEVFDLGLSKEIYETLGLTPGQTITPIVVTEQFNKKILNVHPDRPGGSKEKAQQVISARDEMISALKKKTQGGFGKRYFSTMGVRRAADMPSAPVSYLRKEPPRSTYHHLAHQLIHTVLEEKNYPKAVMLVRKLDIPLDAHDHSENTLLTAAVEKGDINAVRFALDNGASIDTSCHCPQFNTAMHYAVEMGRHAIAEELIKRKANLNLINAAGNSPLDIAMKKNDKKMVVLLESNGATSFSTVPGALGTYRSLRGSIVGYGASDRTLIVRVEHKKPLLLKP